ncbi:MAG: response regulator [Candidatus Sumerlaeaceae bacterium]|nr:response regulator [Candidatus Sumerlaeaceae bacterium]
MPKRRILIVDDESDIRAIVRATLVSRYEVVEAHDGLDAAQKLELVEPDFVVLDVMMPLMDGYDTCRVIRSHPRFKDIPVLFLSALGSKQDIVKGYGAGANLYLTKPFEPARLLRVVDLFFEEKNTPFQRKRFSIEQLEKLDHLPPEAIAEAHASGILPAVSATPPEAAKTPPPPPQAASETPKASSPPPDEPPKPRIILVDDEEDVISIGMLALRDEFEVAGALDGIEAIQKITLYEPDIIVLDVMLPKMSGYQLCQSLRRNKRFAQTPIVIVSAKASPRDQEYALRIGANAFVAKPFDPEALRAALRTIVKQPGFRIYPKSLSAIQMQLEENRRRKEIEERVDKVTRKQESELEKFLREYGQS